MRLALMLAATALSGCQQPVEQSVYTLYRDSPGAQMRLHLATFDAADGDAYNRENCNIARGLFARQPGVRANYWCERGRYRR